MEDWEGKGETGTAGTWGWHGEQYGLIHYALQLRKKKVKGRSFDSFVIYRQ